MDYNLIKRLRRLRGKNNLRDLVKETIVTKDDLIYPLFVREGENIKKEIVSMPEIYQMSIDILLEEIDYIYNKLGIKSVILFGIPEKKDEIGSESFSDEGIIQKAIREIKKNFNELIVIGDVCFCEYTSHGHCGVIKDNELLNDETLELLEKQVIAQAKAGVDIVAPSGMIDGMVKAIRGALDRTNFKNLPIMAYSAKYSSSFYGPFRDAAESAPSFGDRKTYQMDIANRREALREIELDIAEGADIVMVKPALSYLDIIREVRDNFNAPIAAYNVSGEYSLVKAAAEKGWIDEEKLMLEILTSIKRAGADLILTYWAKKFASICK